MTDKLKQTIKEEVEKLPKSTQEAIISLDWANIAEEIGKKHLLSESETNDLQVETLLVLIGLQELNYYAQNIENNIGTSKDEAEKIANDALEKIFEPIYKILSEKIKSTISTKKTSFEENIKFINSGGDYSVFIK